MVPVKLDFFILLIANPNTFLMITLVCVDKLQKWRRLRKGTVRQNGRFTTFAQLMPLALTRLQSSTTSTIEILISCVLTRLTNRYTSTNYSL